MLCTVKLGVAHVVQTSGATAGHVLLTPLAQGRALAARDSSLDAQHWVIRADGIQSLGHGLIVVPAKSKLSSGCLHTLGLFKAISLWSFVDDCL